MKTGIFIGRFQPMHEGHTQAIQAALSQVDFLHIFVGSANQCQSIRNPFSYLDRQASIERWLRSAGVLDRCRVSPLNDHPSNDEQWISDVKLTAKVVGAENPVLFGHTKPGNDYLSWFPGWTFQDIEKQVDVTATQIRERLFRARHPIVHPDVLADWEFYEQEKQLFSNYPYPQTLSFNCADVVLVCSGKVLLVLRKFAPGRNTWALPGGFKQHNETFLECALRELREETNVRVPEKVLRGSLFCAKLFDNPNRSLGIPRLTVAHYIGIEPNKDGSLPRANGGDDASEVRWVDLVDVLNYENLFEDHLDIIATLTGAKPVPAIFTRS